MEICLVTHRTQIAPRWIGNQRMSWEIKNQDIHRVGDCPGRRSPQRNLPQCADHCARPQTVKLSKLRINIKIYVQTVRAHWTDENICELAIFWQVCGLLTTAGGAVYIILSITFCTNCKTPNLNTTISGRKMFKKTNLHQWMPQETMELAPWHP